jgi:hypothetical protein
MRTEQISLPRAVEAASARRKSTAETKTVGPPTRTNRACWNLSFMTHGLKTDVLHVPLLRTATLRVQVPS